MMKQVSPLQPPHRRAWPTVSGLEWAVFGSAAVFLTVLLLFTLFFAERRFLGTARTWDLERVERYIRRTRDMLEAESLTKPTHDTLQELQGIGLLVDVFPADQEIPQPNPRYVASRQSVEGWERVRGEDGRTVSVIRIGYDDSFGRLTLAGIRFYNLAGALGGALIIGFIWLGLRRHVFSKIRLLAAEVASGMVKPPGTGDADGPLGSLQSVVREALAARDKHVTRLEALLARHGELACSSTTEGTLIETNEAYARLFGKSREALAGSNYLDRIPPSDRAEALANVRRLSRRHPVQSVEHRVLLPDGEVRWIRWKDSAVFDAEGKVMKVFSIGVDITTEKNLEENLETLRLAFDQMQSLAGTGSMTWNLTSDRMNWTDETWRLIGLQKDAGTENLDNLLAIVTTSDRQPLGELFRRARENGDPFEYEFRCSLPDGSHRTVQSRVEVRADPKTKLLDQLTCTLHDITALRDAESSTKRELHFRQAIEQSLGTGIVVIDESGKCLLVNPAFCEMTGWPAEELTGQLAPYCYWPEEERPAIREAFERTLRGEAAPEGMEMSFCRKNGTRFDVMIKVAPLLDNEDRPLGWLGAVTDITAIQQTRRDLQANIERLRIAQDVAEIGIWDWDPVKDTLLWDRQSFALFGHPEATDPHAVWSQVHSEAEQERLTYGINRLIAAGLTSGQDLIRARWPDGTVHVISSTYLIMRNPSGRATRVLGVNRDITAELEEERDLRDANERLTAVLEGGDYGTFEHVTGVGDTAWSPANYEIHGIDPSVTDPAELFATWKEGVGDFFPELLARMDAMPVDRQHMTYEFTFRPRGKKPRLIRSSIFVERNGHGHPSRLVGLTRRIEEPDPPIP